MGQFKNALQDFDQFLKLADPKHPNRIRIEKFRKGLMQALNKK
jgi:hypothetical protein